MSEPQRFGRWADPELTDEELIRDVIATQNHFRKLGAHRKEKESRLMRLYNPDPGGHCVDLFGYLRGDRPQFNIIRQGVDTMLAKVASQRFMPRYTVVDGSWTLGRTARKRTRVLEGQVDDLKIGALMYAAARDAYVSGGPGHLIGSLDADGNPQVERALPGEVIVDPRASVYGKPPKYMRRRGIALSELEALFPDADPLLLEASARTGDKDHQLLFMPRDNTLDEIRVDEAWSAGTPARPGVHIICTSRVVLLREEWPYPVPVVPVYYQKRQFGYWGLGIGELGQDEQTYLDKVLRCAGDLGKIESTIYIKATNPNQRFSSEAVPGAPARIMRSSGGDFDFERFTGASNHLYAEVDRIRERFLSLTGISVLDAESKKPAGVNSAPGQRTYADLTAQRQREVSDNIRESWLGVFELLETLNAYAQAQDKNFSVAARTTRGLVPLVQTVRWSDAHLPPEQYRLSLQLVSDVPYQVGSRVEAIQEWVQSGFTRRAFGQKQVLEGPNEDFQRLETADLDYACWMVEEVLEGRVPELDPHLIPEVAFDVFRSAYLAIKSDGAPEEVVSVLRDLLAQAFAAVEAKKAALPAPQDPAGNYAPPAALQLPNIAQSAPA